MRQRLENPQSLMGFWLAVGIVLGISLGILMGSFTVGLPAGLALSFLTGKVSYRIARIRKF